MIGQKCFSMSIYGFQNLFLILHIIIYHHGTCLNNRDPDQIQIPTKFLNTGRRDFDPDSGSRFRTLGSPYFRLGNKEVFIWTYLLAVTFKNPFANIIFFWRMSMLRKITLFTKCAHICLSQVKLLKIKIRFLNEMRIWIHFNSRRPERRYIVHVLYYCILYWYYQFM